MLETPAFPSAGTDPLLYPICRYAPATNPLHYPRNPTTATPRARPGAQVGNEYRGSHAIPQLFPIALAGDGASARTGTVRRRRTNTRQAPDPGRRPTEELVAGN